MNDVSQPVSTGKPGSGSGSGAGALLAGGIAAILASVCCVGPLALLAVGVSGAWIANLTAFEPYRPLFVAGAVVALFFAWRRIYRPVAQCAPGELCAVPRVRVAYKFVFWSVVGLVALALASPWLAPLFY